MDSVKFMDPNIYGIDWNTDDDGNTRKAKPKDKPFCEFQGATVGEGDTSAFIACSERVSTEFGKPKPFCKDHVFENPYVQDLLKRYAQIDENEERKRVRAWEKQALADWKAEYE